MEEIFESFKKYLDDSADPEMLKANPNLLDEVHGKIFKRFEEDFAGQPLPENPHEILATKYFEAYLNDEGKAAFFPAGHFPK